MFLTPLHRTNIEASPYHPSSIKVSLPHCVAGVGCPRSEKPEWIGEERPRITSHFMNETERNSKENEPMSKI
uniref:Uncharacterized protein n=1 Tax=Fagus sylvatica TaxID=28930 RepID=A0A2N9HB57_FAGSY